MRFSQGIGRLSEEESSGVTRNRLYTELQLHSQTVRQLTITSFENPALLLLSFVGFNIKKTTLLLGSSSLQPVKLFHLPVLQKPSFDSWVPTGLRTPRSLPSGSTGDHFLPSVSPSVTHSPPCPPSYLRGKHLGTGKLKKKAQSRENNLTELFVTKNKRDLFFPKGQYCK